jgi:hypothetical protein
MIKCPDPLSIQMAETVDGVGYDLSYPFHKNPFGYPRIFTALNIPLTTWLGRPTWAVDSYRRHLQALREHEDDLKAPSVAGRSRGRQNSPGISNATAHQPRGLERANADANNESGRAWTGMESATAGTAADQGLGTGVDIGGHISFDS